VVLDGLDREIELARDQLVRLAAQQEAEDVGLAGRQLELRERVGALGMAERLLGRAPIARSRRRALAHRHRRHVDAALHDDAQRLAQRLVARALGDEAHRAEVDRADDVGAAVRRRDDDDRDLGPAVAQFDQEVEAVGVAEAQVEEAEVEVVVGSERVARGARAGDTDDRDVVAHPLDHVLQCAQDQRVVVDQQDSHRQAYVKRRPTDSATQTGFSLPSRSIRTS
jgi:hypothetical protein